MINVHPLIRNRQSKRIIDSNKSVDPDDVLSLLEAGRWAPSCANHQSWRFIVSQHTTLEPIKELLPRGNAWAKNAPVMIAVASKPDLGCQRAGRDYYSLDLGLAIENILLQGIHLGLVMHPIAGFDEEGVKKVLGIPEDYRIFVLIVMGHPGSPNDVDEQTRYKDAAFREREALDKVVFWEKWNA